MLKSMTGYGRAEQQVGDKVFLIEIRSLNGKQFEMLLKLPQLLKPYEFDIRNIISEKLVRGSIECIISLKQNGAVKPVSINMDLAKSYFKPLKELSDELSLDSSQLLAAILKLPEVITPSTEVFNEKEWGEFRVVLDQALEAINQHRTIEGEALEKDLALRIQNIGSQQTEVIRQEPQRRQKIRENILKLLEEHVGAEKTDGNRLEQEMIYYIEKIDISEEQVRLKNHCDYFKTLLAENDDVKGKKLSFILQEIGREINTTGAKAYDSEIQKSVVMMKDELEKAKEQVLNVL